MTRFVMELELFENQEPEKVKSAKRKCRRRKTEKGCTKDKLCIWQQDSCMENPVRIDPRANHIRSLKSINKKMTKLIQMLEERYADGPNGTNTKSEKSQQASKSKSKSQASLSATVPMFVGSIGNQNSVNSSLSATVPMYTPQKITEHNFHSQLTEPFN